MQPLTFYGSKQVTWPNSGSSDKKKLCVLTEGTTKSHNTGHEWRLEDIKTTHLTLELHTWTSDQEDTHFLDFMSWFNGANDLLLCSERADSKETWRESSVCSLSIYRSASPWDSLQSFVINLTLSFSLSSKRLKQKFSNQTSRFFKYNVSHRITYLQQIYIYKINVI